MDQRVTPDNGHDDCDENRIDEWRELHDDDSAAGTGETPSFNLPAEFVDQQGRPIEIRAYDDSEETYESLVDMYESFDSGDRAEELPPGSNAEICRWLDTILVEDCVNVLAWCGNEVVGHAMLVPDEDAMYELGIFVQQEYQQAGIGTNLLCGLLRYGQSEGVKEVRLSVEHWNQAAIALYRKVGFETTVMEAFTLEMSLQLDDLSECTSSTSEDSH